MLSVRFVHIDKAVGSDFMVRTTADDPKAAIEEAGKATIHDWPATRTDYKATIIK
jgi:hypothetical protein